MIKFQNCDVQFHPSPIRVFAWITSLQGVDCLSGYSHFLNVSNISETKELTIAKAMQRAIKHSQVEFHSLSPTFQGTWLPTIIPTTVKV